jgi:hypothetical protein
MNGVDKFIKKQQTTFAELVEFMANGHTSMVTSHNGKQYVGRITGIMLEDGSGKCWNVYLQCATESMCMFTRFS